MAKPGRCVNLRVCGSMFSRFWIRATSGHPGGGAPDVQRGAPLCVGRYWCGMWSLMRRGSSDGDEAEGSATPRAVSVLTAVAA
jgi:hypothetical protein